MEIRDYKHKQDRTPEFSLFDFLISVVFAGVLIAGIWAGWLALCIIAEVLR